MITPPKHTLRQIAAAWQAQVSAAADKPWLFTLLMQEWARLFRRFAHFYQRLLTLPRPHKRILRRKLATTLGGAALLLALGQALPARAATITVDGVTCTLAEAIDSANNDSAAGNGCVDGSGADILDLQTDVTLSDLPTITSEITLEGHDHMINGEGGFRLFVVDSSGDLTLNNMTITEGTNLDAGGGIQNFGTVTVNNSTLSDNTAGEHGGGIFNAYSGTVTVNNSTLSGNEGFFGGGISNWGTLTVNNSTLSGNRAIPNSGGGIYNYGTVTLNNSTLSGNTADRDGGGIFNASDSTVTLNNSTLSGNTADRDGGGIFNASDSTVTLNNSTLTGNQADSRRGGGILNAGTLNLNRSLVSGNQATFGPEVFSRKLSNVIKVNANNYNVIGYGGSARSAGFTLGPNDIVPLGVLGTVLDTSLANNGGPTGPMRWSPTVRRLMPLQVQPAWLRL